MTSSTPSATLGFVDRAEEMERILDELKVARTGKGQLLIVRGEAGSGKTRLVQEAATEAEKLGFSVGFGTGLAESVVPYHAWKEVLEGLGLDTILEEPPPPKLLGFYLLTPEGRIQTKVEREDTDSDLLSDLASTLADSVHDSKGQDEAVEGGFTLLSQDGRRILLHRGSTSHLGAIVEGREDEAFLADMMALADKAESIFSGEDIQYEGEEPHQAMEPHMRQLLDSEIYEGIDYAKEDPKLRQNRLFELIALGLSRKAGIHPICVVIDDLQWADPSSLALLHYVARNTRKTGVFLLGTYRVEEAESRPHLRDALKGMEQEELLAEMDLRGLSREDLVELAESFIGPHILSDDFLDYLWRETRGFPLFVREVLRGLEEDNAIEVRGAIKRLVHPVDQLALPERVREVIRARLDRLPKAELRLLDVAATCGTRFTAALVARVAGETEAKVLNGLNAIAKVHGLLRPMQEGFTFDHPAVQEVVYEDVPSKVRQNYHKEAAEWLELAGGPIEDIGEHYYRARDHRAVGSLRKAADASFLRHANDEAIRMFEEALELASTAERGETSERLGALYELTGDFERGLESFKCALELTQGKNKRAEILARAGSLHQKRGEYELAQNLLGRALELLGSEECAETALTLRYLGVLHSDKGEYDEALQYLNNSLAVLGKVDDIKSVADCLNNIGLVHYGQGDYDAALKCYEESLAIREKLANKVGIAASLSNIGLVHARRGDYSKALIYCQKSLAIREVIGDKLGIAASLGNMGYVYLYQGHYEKALECFRKCLPAFEKMGDQSAIAIAYNNMGSVHGERGEHSKALEYYRKSLTIREKLGDQVGIAGSLHNIGVEYELTGGYDEALDHYAKSVALSEKTGHQEFLANHLDAIGRVHRKKGYYRLALEHHEKSLAIRERMGSKIDIASCLEEIGKVYAERGEFDEALHLYDKCVAVSEEAGHQEYLANHLEAIGDVHGNRGDNKRALEYQEKSLVIRERIGDRPGIASALMRIGKAYTMGGDNQRGLEYYRRSLAIHEELGYREELSETYCCIAEALLLEGDLAKAAESCNMAFSLSTEMGQKRHIGASRRVLGTIYRKRKLWKEATENFEDSIRVCREIGERFGEALSHYEFGLMWKQNGDTAKAKEHQTKAGELFEVLNIPKRAARVREALDTEA